MKNIFRSFIHISSLFLIVNSCSKDIAIAELQDRTKYTLTVTASEGGSVQPETLTYYGKTVVTITATPDEGYKFSRWLGTGNDNKPNPCGKGRQLDKIFRECHITIEINSNREIQAFFQRKSE